MKFGKDKQFIQKNLKIPISINGIGEEKHPTLNMDDIPQNQHLCPVEKKVLDIIKGAQEEKEEVKKVTEVENLSKFKLYLNTLINLLNNKKKKKTAKPKRPSKFTKVKVNVSHWWKKDTTDDIKDLIQFVWVHGLLGSAGLLAILTICNHDMIIIKIIQQNIWLSYIIINMGAGSCYYLFLDINTALKDIWRKEK